MIMKTNLGDMTTGESEIPIPASPRGELCADIQHSEMSTVQKADAGADVSSGDSEESGQETSRDEVNRDEFETENGHSETPSDTMTNRVPRIDLLCCSEDPPVKVKKSVSILDTDAACDGELSARRDVIRDQSMPQYVSSEDRAISIGEAGRSRDVYRRQMRQGQRFRANTRSLESFRRGGNFASRVWFIF